MSKQPEKKDLGVDLDAVVRALPRETPPLSVRELMELASYGYIGSIELRATLAAIYPEFQEARDPDVDEAIRQRARIQTMEMERVELETQRQLERERQEFEAELAAEA